MNFQKIDHNTKLRFYNSLRFESEVYAKFRELSKVNNRYSKVDVDKFEYHPFVSTKDDCVWTYENIVIKQRKLPPYMTISTK